MQRSIDRLLRSTLNEQKKLAEGEKEGKSDFIDKDGKIKFDRRLYDLDVYRTILKKIKGFDYRKLKLIKDDFVLKKSDQAEEDEVD